MLPSNNVNKYFWRISYWSEYGSFCIYVHSKKKNIRINIFHSLQLLKMTKIERLNTRVENLLFKAVQEVLEVVKETVTEYQERTARTQRENQSLKRRLQELQDRCNLQTTGKNVEKEFGATTTTKKKV